MIKLIFVTLFLLSIAFLSKNNNERRLKNRRNLVFHPKSMDYHNRQKIKMRAKYASTYRPRIYAFYSHLGNIDYNNVAIWKAAWYGAGWHPVAKTVDDAKRHELYQEFKNIFDSSKTLLDNDKNKDYLKWLAMITNGGGWMSDFDIFPMNISPSEGRILPNGGNFTVYSGVQQLNLISGSAREWERVTKTLLQRYKTSSQEVASFADKNLIFHFLLLSDRPFHLIPKVVEVDKLYRKELNGAERSTAITHPNNIDYEKCIFLEDKKAIHFTSHTTASNLKINLQTVRQWLCDWRKQCIIS